MNEENGSNLTLSALFLDHWKLCLIVVACCTGLAGLFFVVAPRKYQADMKLLVENDRADLVITPGKSGTDAERSDVNETEVNSEMELLRSRDILQAVVRDAKLYQQFQTGSERPPELLSLEKAVIKLQRALNVTSLRKTNIISVSYTAPDPDLAASVLKSLEDRYLSAHLIVHSAPGTYQFFAAEVAKYREQLANAQAALSRFHRDTQIFSLPQQSAALIGRLEDTKALLKDLDVQIGEIEARLAENQKQIDVTADRIVTQVREVANPTAVQQLKTMLTDLQNRRIALIAKFKPTDRSVLELDSEINNTAKALADMQSGKLTERTSDLNGIYQTLKADRVKAEIELQGLKTRRQELGRNIDDYVSSLDVLDQNASQLQNLEDAEKQAQDNYLVYSRRLEEARMAQALDKQKFANVAVIENPVPSPIPVSPKLGLALGLGALFGLFLALAVAFLLGSKGGKTSLPEPTGLSPNFARSRLFSATAGD